MSSAPYLEPSFRIIDDPGRCAGPGAARAGRAACSLSLRSGLFSRSGPARQATVLLYPRRAAMGLALAATRLSLAVLERLNLCRSPRILGVQCLAAEYPPEAVARV